MSVVTLFVESDNTRSERRFPHAISSAELASRLEAIVGIPASAQTLALHTQNGEFLRTVTDLASASDLMVLRVASTQPHAQLDFDDLSQVEKYEMPDDAYDRMHNTVRAFKRRHQMGRFADAKSAMSIDEEDEFREEAARIRVGQRCEVLTPGYDMKRRGTVRFVGKPKFRLGYWVGVEYDEPVGVNDGSVDNVTYFECAPKHGSFVRPDNVTVGDFPEEDLLASDLEEM
ncbi:hypothetical protein IWW55_001037 [Coemansia sp. RSA 2706]|nr:hypothetical protein LPJ63_004794 [Coemansia sp. RSA 2711]KAJ2307325.1 hypothetical protein IWW55_001037 [Coemansia sp. RSA 2706]KAJ2313674.1 hypothetical protein IWW54_001371 [Coemansia sp. RSA 2705]KAJ2316034.1 hypothetical protein IWW52_003847 [Coemansia sp. RSA 2704]KAJ2328914.1 hypothetical protein IWW51_000927 [Coemansia sp. RSA 2702]KAJ2367595.1 hypothetical protein H4S01_002070 [Coemansia sp. RSA 2610]KAJ2383639.1 hypothetical protein H4S02_005206 [Coemansia sp. RSA 2611]KAJ272797